MTQTSSDRPVFINEMPDYQQAVRQIDALSDDVPRLQALAAELGLTSEFERLKSRTAVKYTTPTPESAVDAGMALVRRWFLQLAEWVASFFPGAINTPPADTKTFTEKLQAEREFKDAMATRMLERQVMLSGTGKDMKLVSTAEPSPAAHPPAGLAAKYAVPPVASHAQAAEQPAALIAPRR